VNEPSADPHLKSFWNRFSTNALIRFLLMFASGWALVVLLQYFEDVIFIFTFAAILAFLLRYPERYLERYLGRGPALSIVIMLSLCAFITLSVSIGLTITSQLQQLITAVIQDLNSSNNTLVQLERLLAARNIDLNLAPIAERISNLLTYGVSLIAGSLPSVFGTVVNLIFIIVIAFFMLIDGERLWYLVLKVLPNYRREHISAALQHNFMGFFRGQFIVASMLVPASWLVYSILQIPFALSLAVLLGGFTIIPGIGATLGVATTVLIAFVQGGWLTAIKVFLAGVVLEQILDNFVLPRVMQSTVNLNPVIIFFALLIGGRVAGLFGIILAVPIAGTIVNLLEIEEMQSKSATLPTDEVP
jgi:predicted PurR-regulated permease PerM